MILKIKVYNNNILILYLSLKFYGWKVNFCIVKVFKVKVGEKEKFKWKYEGIKKKFW